MKKELENEDDIKLLVDTFYDKVNANAILSPVFNDFAQINWEHHLPVMYNFWSTVLFGSMTYKGQPFPKHLRLPVDTLHFEQWISLFTATVDELFEGERATEAKQKATSIAQIFQLRMGLLDGVSKGF